jgi:D-glycero-alpha-D-manno-heptose 1-phosphate guanylyltransferase
MNVSEAEIIPSAVILAGGFGTRLQSLVSDVPKPMASVGGRPFRAYLLDYLNNQGIARVILALGYKHQAIIDYFGNRYRSLDLSYLIEESPLGTGGALRWATAVAAPGPIMALNGDTFLAMEYGPMFAAHLAGEVNITIALRFVPNAGRYGGVVVDQGRITSFLEKGSAEPGWINAGVYILDRDIFTPFHLPEVFSFERDFLQKYCSRLLPLAYFTKADFIDIGTPEDYLRVQAGLEQFFDKECLIKYE